MKYKLFSTLLFAAMAAALAPAAAATTWYVNGVTGSDNNNCLSPTTACKTIGPSEQDLCREYASNNITMIDGAHE